MGSLHLQVSRIWLALLLLPAAVSVTWFAIHGSDHDRLPDESTTSNPRSLSPVARSNPEIENDDSESDHAAKALRYLTEKTELSGDIIADLSARWFAEVGPACLESIRAEDPGPVRDEWLKKAITTWASGAPEDALDWLSRFHENPLASQARSEVFKVWAIDDPSAAAAWFQSNRLPESELPVQKKVVMGAWTKMDVEGALEWMNQESDPGIRDELARQAAISAGESDRTIIADAVLHVFPDPWNEPAVETLLRSWFVNEPEAAAQWMLLQKADAPFIERVKAGITQPDIH
ncbi:MAG: hypothetical protein MUF13_12580 [Akkermansiaceae bacterium]|nr:hypothetical protein [Akkermansiaceae bacterium]